MHIKLLSVCVMLFIIVLAGLGADLEDRAVAKIKAHSRTYYGHAPENEDEKKLEVVRDRFLFFLVGGGSFGGAVVCVMLRLAWAKKIKQSDGTESYELSRQKIASFFVVSMLTALFCSGWMVKKYMGQDGDAMFMGSFLIATAAWVLWEIAAILGEQIKKAAEARGWLGVKEALTGTMIATPTASPPEKKV